MRTDGDDWDITTSVGATALMVAASRAHISQQENSLINDPYAQLFVDAAGYDRIDFLNPQTWDSEQTALFNWMKVHIALRTKIIDEAIIAAVSTGVRQLVILASGLDVRPYRMPELAEVATFEIDRDRILEFKETVLHKHGVSSTSHHIAIAADLRDNWIDLLIAKGFNPTQPTVWVTEGLLPYLPAEAQWNLARTIEENSPVGSRWILDISDGEIVKKFTQLPSAGPIDMNELFYNTDVPSSIELVRSWSVQPETMGINLGKYKIDLPLIQPEFTRGKTAEQIAFLEHTMYDSGFYIADKLA